MCMKQVGKTLATMMMGAGCMLVLPAVAGAAECVPTASSPSASDYAPKDGEIPRGNNLARPAGKAVVAAGQQLRLQGRVLDRDCKPVEGAVVELWQANRDGLYQYADRAALANPYAVFAGAGRTTTDNAGRFDFYTLFPGGTLENGIERAPRLHVRVRHRDVKALTTELFFDAERRNATDPVYQKLPGTAQQGLTLRVVPYARGELLAETTLIVDGHQPYVQY
jgi:protocatechuate 3,4-dioxygenase beta subunit